MAKALPSRSDRSPRGEEAVRSHWTTAGKRGTTFQTKEAQRSLKAACAHGKLSCQLHVSGRPKLDLTLFRASRRNKLGQIEYFKG